MNRIVRWLSAGCLPVLLFVAIATDAPAGRNSGGALVVHTEPGLIYSRGHDYCGASYTDPGRCIDAVTQVDVMPGEAAILWILAAFPAGASPAVRIVQFGIDHTVGLGAIVDHDACAIAIDINEDFPAARTSIAVNFYPTTYRTLFPVYWFAVYGSSGDTFSSIADPVFGSSVFIDESEPNQMDEIYNFGTARWGSPGDNDCPLSVEQREASLGEIKAGFR